MRYEEVGAWSGKNYPPGSVVVGYNGKDHSRHALAWAVREAFASGNPLLVLYAANYSGMTIEPGPGLHHREPGALEAAEEVTAEGVDEALDLCPSIAVVGATEVLSPVQALTQAGESAAVVVLGNRGLGRVLGGLLGSVAFNVAARAVCPVIVVKDETADRQLGSDHRVVVGTDGSEQARAAVAFAAARAAVASAPLEIVTCTGGHQVKDVDEVELRGYAERIAAAAADETRTSHPGLAVTIRVEDCPAEDTLVGLSSDAGLVVVGTRGRGAFEGMLLGSVGHAVVHGAECAVAVV